MANVYKLGFLEKLPTNELLNKQELLFYTSFPYLITSKDKFFWICYSNLSLVDSLISCQGWSQSILQQIISKEEIEPNLANQLSLPSRSPLWTSIRSTIQNKYSNLNADRVLLDYQINYYKNLKWWNTYVKVVVERVRRFGDYGPISVKDFNLNNIAWEIFIHSDSREYLEHALRWSEMAVSLNHDSNKPNWIDTEANILYKLGYRQRAIDKEKEAILLDPASETFKLCLEKMKKGVRTWS